MEKEFTVELWRVGTGRRLLGHYSGYPIIRDVAVEKSMVLRAANEADLALMVAIAAVDGWKVNENGSK